MMDAMPVISSSIAEKLSLKKILVIDEDEFVCDLITRVLTRYLGCEVFGVRDGGEGIAAALTGRYDGAIVDLLLQKTSGQKIIRAIRTMLPSFPIIAMATLASEELTHSVRQLGITTILYKPFKITALIEGVTEVFGAGEIALAQK
jgi:DNA-binding response OmpR family regulator